MKDRRMLFATCSPICMHVRRLTGGFPGHPGYVAAGEGEVVFAALPVFSEIMNHVQERRLNFPSFTEYRQFRVQLCGSVRGNYPGTTVEFFENLLADIRAPQGRINFSHRIQDLHASMSAERDWNGMIAARGRGWINYDAPPEILSPLDQFSIPVELFFSISLSILLALGLVLLLIRWRNDRLFLFAAILSICALSSKQISIYNEEMIVARCFIGFLIFSRKSFGKTFQETLDGRIESIQEELQQFFNPNEVIPEESNEQQRLLRISLRICSTVVESLPTARCAPKCEKTVQALLCRNLNVKSATLLNATSSRRIRLQDDIVTGFHFSVSERFLSGSTFKASTVEEIREAFVPIDLIREGLIVLRKVRVGGSIMEE